MATYTLAITNKTSMVGQIRTITMGNATWAPDKALVVNQRLTARATVFGRAEVVVDADTPCSVIVEFGMGTAGPGSGVVTAKFGAQVVNRGVTCYMGASVTTGLLRSGAQLFTDVGVGEPRFYIGLVTIDVLRPGRFIR